MKKLNKGIKEIIAGLVGGLLFSAVLNFFKQSGVIPSNLVIWFTVIDIFFSDGRGYFHSRLDTGRLAVEKFYEQYRFSGLFLGAGSDPGFPGLRGHQKIGFSCPAVKRLLTDCPGSIIIGATLTRWRVTRGI
jgi:hypothetical protein